MKNPIHIITSFEVGGADTILEVQTQQVSEDYFITSSDAGGRNLHSASLDEALAMHSVAVARTVAHLQANPPQQHDVEADDDTAVEEVTS